MNRTTAFSVDTGRTVRIRADVVAVRAADGSRMRICRRVSLRAIATARFARDETGALRRKFILLSEPLVRGVREFWVTQRIRA